MAYKAVLCYARKDKDFRDDFDRHLSSLKQNRLIVLWSDKEISPGKEWEKEIHTQLDAADLILLLISSDFMDSQYCYSFEMQYALERHKADSARVIPILLRPVDWENEPFNKLHMLPEDARPITLWKDRDQAWKSVVQDIRRVIHEWSTINEESTTVSDVVTKIVAPNSALQQEPNTDNLLHYVRH